MIELPSRDTLHGTMKGIMMDKHTMTATEEITDGGTLFKCDECPEWRIFDADSPRQIVLNDADSDARHSGTASG